MRGGLLGVELAERRARVGDEDQKDAEETRGVREPDQNVRSWYCRVPMSYFAFTWLSSGLRTVE